MNKYIYTIIMILFIGLASATVIDKKILKIDNCYNVSISTRLTSGDPTPYWFKDCSNHDGIWTCNCRDTLGEYNLTLQSDDKPLDSNHKRYYTFDIIYNKYQLNRSTGKLIISDSGYATNTVAKNFEDEGRAEDIVYMPIYVNQTVYVDRVVNNTEQEVKIVKEIQYVENTTKIELLSNITTSQADQIAEYSNTISKLETIKVWLIAILSIIILAIIGVYILSRMNDEE